MEFVALIIQLALVVALIAGFWKVFVKAGHPGWAVIVPIYNLIVMLKIAGKPVWWVILCFIPLVNLVIFLFISISIAERFGKGTGFGIGLWLLGFVFYPLLGFSDAQYQGGPA